MFDVGGRLRRYELYHELNSVPLGFPAPVVLTILDLSVRLYPETHPGVRVEIFNRYFYNSLKHVRRIITISGAIKKELVEMLGVPTDRIDVIHLAADEHFRPIPPAQVRGYLRQQGLPERYILYLGTLEPRKNLAFLLRAYADLPFRLRSRFPLVLAGFKGWPGDDSPYRALEREVEELGLNDRVIFTGFVPEADLPFLYNGAVAFVFPSIYEGFGLPPLEAMQCGVPVIASDVPALAEVIGGAGDLLRVEDQSAWTAGLAKVLEDAEYREELSRRGISRARSFSWDKCARQTIATYEAAMVAQ